MEETENQEAPVAEVDQVAPNAPDPSPTPAQTQVIGPPSRSIAVAGLKRTKGVTHIPGFGGDRSDLLNPIDKGAK